MNDITQAGILFNAAYIPYDYFMKLCTDYDPHEAFAGVDFWKELGAKDGWIARELDILERLGGRFITAKDIDYPAKLSDLKRPPVGLYVKGKVNLSLPSAAIVGTRKPSSYGQNTAANLARSLARQGVITISGGARGIDSAAHRGSLQDDGITIAVFGTSIDKVYPTENRDLFERITERGAVVSEYPIGCPGEGWHFPAMSSRVVIVEAGDKSGALITAGYAEELGRELWAVPGRITDETCRGTNALITRGAKCLYDIGEFVESFTGRHEQLELFGEDDLNGENEEITTAPELGDDEKVIYSLLQKKGKVTLDELVAESKLDAIDVQSALIMLQAEGLVSEATGRYSAVK